MSVNVRIPAPLRKFSNGESVVECDGVSVNDVMGDLEKKCPGIKERIYDEQGNVRRFINIFVDGDDIRFKDGLRTKVKEKGEVSIVPAIAGGL